MPELAGGVVLSRQANDEGVVGVIREDALGVDHIDVAVEEYLDTQTFKESPDA